MGVFFVDIQKLTSTLLSADAIGGLSKRSGASAGEVKQVLSQALPVLLGGADEQAKGADTAAGFAAALASHAKSNTLDLSDFLGNVDLEDGAKIIGHLLGGSSEKTTKSVAKKAGVSNDKTASILAAAAPLLMSLLGQQTEDEDTASPVGELIGTLLSNVDVGELLVGLLTDDGDTKKKASTKKSTTKKTATKSTTTKKTATKKSSTKKSAAKKADESTDLGDVVGSLLKGLLK